MSKLDRFLISIEGLELCPEVCQNALLKTTSDHCGILLDSRSESWGPISFRFELMWLKEKDFPRQIKGWWDSLRVHGWAGHRLLMKLNS